MKPGSGSTPTIRSSTSTIPAPAIASRSIVRWSSRWRSARSSAGWSMAASTAFASTSPPTLGRRDTGLRPRGAVLPGARRRSRARQRAPHRRALGHRPRRLPARPVPARVRRLERSLSRRRAPLLARRSGAARRDRDPDRGFARRVRGAPRRRPRASISSSSMTASRFATSSPTSTSTTRPTARTIATARTTTTAGTMASRGRATIRRSSNRARATSAICSRFCSPRAGRRCSAWARSSASARAATTTPTPRTTRQARSTGAPPTLR